MNEDLIKSCRHFLVNLFLPQLYNVLTDTDVIEIMKKMYPLTYKILEEEYE